MRRSSLGFGLVLTALLLTASACGGSSGSSSSSDNATGTTTTSSSDGSKKISGESLQDIVKKQKNVKCTYSLASLHLTGTTYIADGKLSATYKASYGGQPEVTSHVLNDGTYTYMWSDGTTAGTKYKNSAVEAITTTTKAGETPTTNAFSQQFDFDCSKWTPDDSLFNAPSNVTFTDSTDLVTNPAKSADDIKKQACDSSPELKKTSYCAGVN